MPLSRMCMLPSAMRLSHTCGCLRCINNITIKRNNSILAHGLESLDKEDFVQFEELVENLARKLDKDMGKFLKETRFAKFDLKVKMNEI